MKHAIAVGTILAAALAAGCNTAKKPVASVTEPLTPAPTAYTAAPQPYTPSPMSSAQPVVYDSTPTPAMAASNSAVGSGNYTVKHGDTLYSIARSRYGNGNQYTRIVAANPGLTPQKLKVGQTITIP